MLFFLKSCFATFLYTSACLSVFSKCLGSSNKALVILFLDPGKRLCTFISVNRSKFKADNCVTKALVEATPISGPALVKSVKSDSRQIELFATLHIARESGLPVFFANFKDDSVSAVSPD